MKKLSFYLATTFIITILALGFLLFLFFQKEKVTNTNQMVSIEKEIYLLTSTQIVKTRLENGVLKTLDSKEHGISEVKKIARGGNFLYVSNAKKIYKFNSNLNKATELNLGIDDDINDFTVDHGNVYVLTQDSKEKRKREWYPGMVGNPGALKIFDNSLRSDEPVSKIDFKKAGDAITQKGNFLFVLDNVTTPMYVFLIDISDIKNPEFYSSKELSGINSSLLAQDITNNKWYVLGGYGTMGGSGEFIYIFDTTPEINQLKKITTQTSQRLSLGSEEEIISTSNFVVRDNLLIAQGRDYNTQDEKSSVVYTLNFNEGDNPDFIDKKNIPGPSIHYNLLDLNDERNTFLSAHGDVLNQIYVDDHGRISITPIESSYNIIGMTK